jgi:hypothetical protein
MLVPPESAPFCTLKVEITGESYVKAELIVPVSEAMVMTGDCPAPSPLGRVHLTVETEVQVDVPQPVDPIRTDGV